MRSTLLIVGTFLLLGVVFGIYMASQGHQATAPQLSADATPPSAVPTQPAPQQELHAGQDATFKVYDKNTGSLTGQYSAHQYDPQPDGTMFLTAPVADFFLADGQMARLVAKTGRVVMPAGAQGARTFGANQAPSRGVLHDVTLQLFHTPRDAEPYETCVLDNLSFDNDTFTVAAGPILDSSGNVVTPADQVPVVLRGTEYDFDGRGLLIKWDERDRHLRLLEIAHGERLIIKHPGKAALPGVATGRTATAELQMPSELDGALASADNRAAVATVQPSATPPPARRRPKKRPPAPAPPPGAPKPSATRPDSTQPSNGEPYEAAFDESVVVTQAGDTLARGDQMDVDFLTRNGSSGGQGSASAGAHATTQPATSVAEAAVEQVPPVPATPKAASTAPSDQPLIITWTGKLTAVPLLAGDLSPGDSVVQMSGTTAPVALNRQGSSAVCATFRYHTLDDSLTMTSSPICPVIHIDDEKGSHITTPSLDYDGASRTAVLDGASHAILPIQGRQPSTESSTAPAPATQPVVLDATWSRLGTIVLAGKSRQELQPSHVTLDGDVHVVHPQIDLHSGQLDLSFDPATTQPTTTDGRAKPTSQPVLRVLEATEAVDCRLKGTGNAASDGSTTTAADQRIQCQHLTVESVPDLQGNASPRRVLADGDVIASNPDQQLAAQHLLATLEPATQPAADSGPPPTTQHDPADVARQVRLKSLWAKDRVQFAARDGSGAEADQLNLTQSPDGRQVQLLGKPMAQVHNKSGTLWGPTIWFDEATQQTRVIGAGHARMIQQPSAGATTRPMNLAWSQGLYVNGMTNHGQVDGNVNIDTLSSDGSRDSGSGDRLLLLLADAPPTTRPATKPSHHNESSPLAGGNSNFMKDKVVAQLHFIGLPSAPVEMRSLLADAASDRLLRRMHLFAPELFYSPVTHDMLIPDPGRMLIQDNRGSSTTGDSSAAGPGGSRGATAFQWADRLNYDDALNRVTMLGNVVVVHESPSAQRYELHAHKVWADLERSPTTQPAKSSATKPSVDAATSTAHGKSKASKSKPATTQPNEPEQMNAHLRRLCAEGDVRMISGRLSFSADSFEYDPVANVMTARAGLRHPAHLLDANGVSTATFETLRYNTQTEQIESIEDFHAEGRNK